MENKREYTAPVLTVVSFKAEKGYAGSGVFATMDLFHDLEELDDNYNSQNQENWYESEQNFFGSW